MKERFPGYHDVRHVYDGRIGPLYHAVSDDGEPVSIRVVPLHRIDPERIRHASERLAGVRGIATPLTSRRLDEGRAFVVTTRIDGDPLSQFPRGWRAIAIREVIRAARARGVEHPELTPESIFVDGRGNVTIADFGLAPSLGRGIFPSAPSETTAYSAVWFQVPSERARRRKRAIIVTTSAVTVLLLAMVAVLNRRPDYSPPGPTSAELTLENPYMNAWLETRNTAEERVVERLDPQLPYWFAFDISRVAYDVGATSWEPSQSLREAVRWASERQLKTLPLRVRPLLVGRGLTWPKGETIDIQVWSEDRWRPTSIRTGESIRLELDVRKFDAALRVSDDPTPDNAQARAAGFRMPLYTGAEPDCGAIALSIWRDDVDIPIDHVVAFVPIGNAQCGAAQGWTKRAPTDNFIGSLVGASPLRPAAAVHLFDFPASRIGQSSTVAVYASGAGLQAPCEHYAWHINGSIRDITGIVSATAISDGRNSAHRTLARALAQELFPLGDDKCDSGGRLALEHLKTVAKSGSQVLFARAVRSDGQGYVPLHLIFALGDGEGAGPKPAFDRWPILVEPLPQTTFATDQPCIGDFAYVIPRKLRGAGTIDIGADLRHLEGTTALKRDRKAFDSYTATPAARSGRATLLVVLAHHGDGKLSFENELAWSTALLRGDFAPGSVAVLAACSSGAVSEKHLGIVETLNQKRFDAAVIAPYDIPVEAGVKLALNFTRAVEHARKNHETPMITDLLESAVTASHKELMSQKNVAAASAIREFYVAGNGGIRLCK